ncbi:hypothetical protein EC957_003320 [Mortierella hygrophila]|uniref:Galactose oxidase n=1 Tax=Mortierella hygrophila TaxID=979708 RepID=A0A9P6F3L4_9FUNG|nr:hypothetical protein EC957_003320 [Mortierella hygrophila]
MVQAVPSKDGLHFVTGGNRGVYGPLSYIYSTQSKTWTTTSTLPGLASLVGYKRFNVGMALDKVTGLVYIYGGLQEASFSKELTVLDTSPSDATKMSWTLSTNNTFLPALYEPFAVFLPTRNKTLVFGGCDYLDPSNGLVGNCYPLSTGFLISNGQNASQLLIESRPFNTPVNPPSPRYQSCRVVLPDGNVFVQGGKNRDSNVDIYFSDAWILNVTDWTWRLVDITGPVTEMIRAGHACQLGAYGQIVVVGGGGVALAILAVGVAGFIFWRRHRSSSPPTPHTQKLDAPSSRLQRGGGDFEKSEAGFSRTINVPRGPAYISSSQPTVQAVYTPPPPPHAIVEGSEPPSPTMTTLPLYAGYATSDEIVSTPSTVVSKKRSLFGITKSSSKSNLGETNSNGNGDAGSDAALAAALLQAEDSSSSWNTSSRKGTFSDNKDHIPFQQMAVNHIRVPSTKPNQQKPQLDSYGSSSTSSSASPPHNRPPTIHTFVKNTVQLSSVAPRHIAGPQSLVPEEEAKFQRFSPGVPIRTVTTQDLDQDGHYPPLTPTRGYGPSSILIGSSGPATPNTSVTSPLHHSAIMAYPDLIAMGAQPLPGHPAAIEGGTRASGYFGQPAYSHSGSASTTNVNSNNGGDGNGSQLYRDPRMAKDLDQIAREIESQTVLAPKGPHALVPPSFRTP